MFAAPDQLGDFLTGLFALAREEAQRDRDLLTAIHAVVLAWNDDSFLTALPSLRLAFSCTSPREKECTWHVRSSSKETPALAAASSLYRSRSAPRRPPGDGMFETMLFGVADQYGVRLTHGGDTGEAS